MGWFSKILGIDSKQHKEQDARDAQAKADAAAAEAAKQAAQTAADTKSYNDAMLEIQKSSQLLAQNQASTTQNNSVDLKTDASANVVAGGSAQQAADDTTLMKKQKIPTSGLSTQLGINV